jgi:two-component system sensor histidine kinase EvgS
VASERGQGSCFTVRATFAAAEAVALSAPAAEPEHGQAAFAGLRVLVVDDHPANRMLLTAQLRLLGCVPRACEDGAAALAAWRANPACVDLILTDCSMPVMSGEDLTRAVRADERQRYVARPVPILGVTANAQPEAAADAVAAGMTACLVKPLSLDELRRALRAAAGTGPRTEAAVETPAQTERVYDSALIAAFGAQSAALVAALKTANTDDLAAARNAFEARDYRRLQETAHRMKGAAFVVGATPFASACLALQAACQTALDAPSTPHSAGVANTYASFADAAATLDAALADYAEPAA